MDGFAREFAARRGIRIHFIVDTFEAVSIGLAKHGRCKRETDRAAMVLTLGHCLGLSGPEAVEIAGRMFPESKQ